MVPGGERGGVHVPDEQTGLTGHGESGAAQRLPLQRADGPLTAVLQRGARGAAGTLQELHLNCPLCCFKGANVNMHCAVRVAFVSAGVPVGFVDLDGVVQ